MCNEVLATKWYYSCRNACLVSTDCASNYRCSLSSDLYGTCVWNKFATIQEWVDTSNLQQISTLEDIPSKCDFDKYDVGLYSFANQSSHFYLGATASSKEVDIECPLALAFAAVEGAEVTFLVPNEEVLKGEQFPVHPLGTANLKDILEAERAAEAIDDAAYDLTANTCVHYAADIWRGLDFEETEDLANFISENLLKKDGFLEYARQNAKYDGRRVLTSYLTGNHGGFEDYVKEMVLSQLNIKK